MIVVNLWPSEWSDSLGMRTLGKMSIMGEDAILISGQSKCGIEFSVRASSLKLIYTRTENHNSEFLFLVSPSHSPSKGVML